MALSGADENPWPKKRNIMIKKNLQTSWGYKATDWLLTWTKQKNVISVKKTLVFTYQPQNNQTEIRSWMFGYQSNILGSPKKTV